MTSEGSSLRLAIFGVVILSLFSSLFARLWYLQMIDSEDFVRAAESNQVKLVFEEAPRGRVLDRHGRVLVDNRLSEVVTVDKAVIVEHPDVIDRLAAVLNLAPAELQSRMDDVRYSGVGPVAVAEDIPEATIVFLREHRDEFPGVEERKLSRRTYPNGALAAHVLGYVGEVNQGELGTRRVCSLELLGRVSAGEVDCYLAGDSIGKTGVEQAYESELRGQPSVTKLEVDSRGRVVRSLGTREPVNGHDVQLTLDLDLQRLTEESLSKALERARNDVDREEKKHFRAPAGSAVVLDPRDGGVIAMASYPSYDPAEFVNGISRDRFQQLQDPANHFPLNNRAVQGQYAPGS
ncbi:MAG TPA: penicillin-binding transpeptidase domain-containing protein, partial [Acidimicrobiales bacterium]|nr:penicillin-binding transpeptidase domain-containing protein [Acidimicrobiales bacterium]